MSYVAERAHSIGADIAGGLFARKTPVNMPTASEDMTGRVEKYLLEHGGWATASAIQSAMAGLDERELRAIAAQSLYIASAPGTPGYKHIRNMTVSEFQDQIWTPTWSQAKKMMARAIRLARKVHGEK